MYSKTSFNIRVTVDPYYILEQSAPQDNHHFWAYTVRIDNMGQEKVKLQARVWEITDDHGQTHHIQGEGVVGEQPVIEPGKSFEYTSGVPLQTGSAIMRGFYIMRSPDGKEFDVTIPAFSLDSPYMRRRIH